MHGESSWGPVSTFLHGGSAHDMSMNNLDIATGHGEAYTAIAHGTLLHPLPGIHCTRHNGPQTFFWVHRSGTCGACVFWLHYELVTFGNSSCSSVVFLARSIPKDGMHIHLNADMVPVSSMSDHMGLKRSISSLIGPDNWCRFQC